MHQPLPGQYKHLVAFENGIRQCQWQQGSTWMNHVSLQSTTNGMIEGQIRTFNNVNMLVEMIEFRKYKQMTKHYAITENQDCYEDQYIWK